MKKILSAFQLTTIRKKTLLLSKLMGGTIVLFYLLTSELPADSSLSFLIWFCLMAAVIICVDILLGRLISTPLKRNQPGGRADGTSGLHSTLPHKLQRRIRQTLSKPEYHVRQSAGRTAKAGAGKYPA